MKQHFEQDFDEIKVKKLKTKPNKSKQLSFSELDLDDDHHLYSEFDFSNFRDEE